MRKFVLVVGSTRPGRFADIPAQWMVDGARAYDAFIATVAEYNHGPTAVLKNAFDSAYFEWNRKPIAFVGYGRVGGARAIEQLRGVAVELQMAQLKWR